MGKKKLKEFDLDSIELEIAKLEKERESLTKDIDNRINKFQDIIYNNEYLMCPHCKKLFNVFGHVKSFEIAGAGYQDRFSDSITQYVVIYDVLKCYKCGNLLKVKRRSYTLNRFVDDKDLETIKYKPNVDYIVKENTFEQISVSGTTKRKIESAVKYKE